MKKKLSYLCLFIIIFSLGKTICYASSASLTANSYTITKGNNVTLTVTIKTDYPLVSIEGKLNCTGVVNQTYDLNYDDSSNSLKSKTYSYTLNPKSAGSITCSLLNARVTHMNSSNWENLAANKVTITVNNPPATQPKVLSSNNFLTSLTVEGLTLNEQFDKENLIYSVTVPAETEKIRINAQLSDSNATINGVGEVAVTSGLNTLNIVVTAENGSKRTYTLNATVQELNPLEVKIDDATYTIVRKRKDLPKVSEYFSEKNIKIGEDTIEGYTYEKLNYTIIGLKDKKGNISYYLYEDNKYISYKECTFGQLTLRILDKELPKNYLKTSFTYGSNNITSYQETKLDVITNNFNTAYQKINDNQFYLFYAINLETGKENLYQYDVNEKTVQRYNKNIIDMYKEANNLYYICLLSIICFLIFLIICFSIALSKKKNKKQKLNKHNMEFLDE